jgi:hypothetical protein
MGKPKKEKNRSDQAIEFFRGFLGDKRNKSPVSNFVRATTERDKKLKKIRGK